ncbi:MULTISPECIES: hypothetical protein [Gordonia]|uniref:Uncharacterized protein n=2 Tax=Gordonia TaxID=2053 RepID=L7LRM4_9ACTN|nr:MULTISPECIES: hypothetical protein [Gordonia]GAC62812.1 hypothetical protein GSI01S_44_00250 [Gordonia sihwensis NBRC 108236]
MSDNLECADQSVTDECVGTVRMLNGTPRCTRHSLRKVMDTEPGSIPPKGRRNVALWVLSGIALAVVVALTIGVTLLLVRYQYLPAVASPPTSSTSLRPVQLPLPPMPSTTTIPATTSLTATARQTPPPRGLTVKYVVRHLAFDFGYAPIIPETGQFDKQRTLSPDSPPEGGFNDYWSQTLHFATTPEYVGFSVTSYDYMPIRCEVWINGELRVAHEQEDKNTPLVCRATRRTS